MKALPRLDLVSWALHRRGHPPSLRGPSGGLGLALTILLALATFMGGCGLTADDIQTWPERKGGLAMLAALVADQSRDLDLRAAAARLLVKNDGTLELADALARVPEDTREELVSGMTSLLIGMLHGSEADQVRAKETIFYVGGYADQDHQRQLADELVAWSVGDFAKRFRLGDTTLEQVLSELGPVAAKPLLELLHRGGPPRELVATLLAMKNPEVARATALVLVERARRARPGLPAPLMDAVLMIERQEMTPLLIELAGDSREAPADRGEYLDHVLKCRGQAAVPGLVGLLTKQDIRWAAASHLLALEGLGGLALVLESLPPDAAYADSDQELYQNVDYFCQQDVAGLKVDVAQLQDTLVKGFEAGSWPGKLTAAHCLGYYGTRDAIPVLAPFTRLTRRLPGWKPADTTLGEVVSEAIAKMRDR